MKQVHEGHRQRLRERFLKEGLDGFQEHEVLELLLFYALPRKDTNELAHKLMERFGNLPQVLEADPKDLKSVEGMGDVAAAFLHMIPAVMRYYGISKAKRDTCLRSIDACGEYVMDFYKGLTKENVYLLCMDAKCKVLGCLWVGEGNVNSATIPIRRVVELALGVNATAVVLTHNHPSGFATPSKEDVATTKRLAVALSSVDVVLADHIVVADDDFTSMVLSGLYRPAECTWQG